MTTLLHTFIHSVLITAVSSILSAPSFGATSTSVTPVTTVTPVTSITSLSTLPVTSIIKPFLITDLIFDQPTTETEFTGKALLDSIGVYTVTPKVYKVIELDTNPIIMGLQLLRQGKSLNTTDDKYAKALMLMNTSSNVTFNTDRIIQLNDKWVAFRSDQDPSASFELDGKTGNIHYNAGLKNLSDEKPTANLPKSNEEIVQFAANHLINFGLLPPLTEINLQNIEYGGVNMAVPDGKGGSKIYEKLRTIRAYRVLDGLEVQGDSRLFLHIGEQGSLVGLIKQWPTLSEGRPLITVRPLTEKSIGQPLTQSDLIPADKLREAALANIQRVIYKTKTAVLKEVKLVLYDDGQGVIEPAYHFVVNRTFDLSDGVRGSAAANSSIPYDFYLPIFNKSRAVFPDMEAVRVLPLGGKDETPVNAGPDEQ